MSKPCCPQKLYSYCQWDFATMTMGGAYILLKVMSGSMSDRRNKACRKAVMFTAQGVRVVQISNFSWLCVVWHRICSTSAQWSVNLSCKAAFSCLVIGGTLRVWCSTTTEYIDEWHHCCSCGGKSFFYVVIHGTFTDPLCSIKCCYHVILITAFPLLQFMLLLNSQCWQHFPEEP